jgi:hypothetical protein
MGTAGPGLQNTAEAGQWSFYFALQWLGP